MLRRSQDPAGRKRHAFLLQAFAPTHHSLPRSGSSVAGHEGVGAISLPLSLSSIPSLTTRASSWAPPSAWVRSLKKRARAPKEESRAPLGAPYKRSESFQGGAVSDPFTISILYSARPFSSHISSTVLQTLDTLQSSSSSSPSPLLPLPPSPLSLSQRPDSESCCPSTKCWTMAQSIQSVHEHMLYASADNATSHSTNILDPVPSGAFSFQPKVIVGFALVLLIVLARVFGAGKQKLPPGVKRLPRLPGTRTSRACRHRRSLC